MASDLLSLHQRNNRESAGLWDDFASHRARVTALALAAAPEAGGTLAVLGAGNCNDLDLPALAARYAAVHLIDLDPEAVARARARQPADVADKLIARAPIDLSGVFDRLPRYRKQPATPVELANLPGRSTAAVAAAIPERFDAVISTCFLSQLMQSAFAALGAGHKQLHLIACALAMAHVRAVVQLLRPGGTAHLVTDVCTTDSYPLVELWDRQKPEALLAELEKSNNVFSGTGPSFLRRILVTDRDVGPALAAPPRLVTPWLWQFTSERTYLVYAYSFTRA